MSIIVISDGRIIGTGILVAGALTITGSFINANSLVYAGWVINPNRLHLNFVSLGSGTVTFQENGASAGDTFNWMVLN